MTIAAGFKCSDGIVLCADSQMTAVDGTKYNAEKILAYSGENVNAIFAFAGGEVFSKMCIERLAECVLESGVTNVEDKLRNEALLIHQMYAPWATINTTDYDLDVLVAVRFHIEDEDKGKLALHHIEGPAVSPPIKHFDCIGIGRTVARQAIGLFYNSELSVQEASRVGVYCLKQAKDHVEGCGGPSQITMLWDDTDELFGPTNAWNMEQPDILEVETGFTALFEALRPVFLSFNNIHPYDPSFAKHLTNAAKNIKKMWSKTFGKIVQREKKENQEISLLTLKQEKQNETTSS
jgi:hypothetical protein